MFLAFNPYNFVANLPYMGKGMLGIVVVILLIMGITALLNRLTNKKEK